MSGVMEYVEGDYPYAEVHKLMSKRFWLVSFDELVGDRNLRRIDLASTSPPPRLPARVVPHWAACGCLQRDETDGTPPRSWKSWNRGIVESWGDESHDDPNSPPPP